MDFEDLNRSTKEKVRQSKRREIIKSMKFLRVMGNKLRHELPKALAKLEDLKDSTPSPKKSQFEYSFSPVAKYNLEPKISFDKQSLAPEL